MRYSRTQDGYTPRCVVVSIEGARVRRANRDAKLYGEHVTLDGEHVTREQCVIESIELYERDTS